MRFPNKEIVEKVRRDYPVGCRVELVRMDDVQAPPIGTKGTVRGVDDTASIMVRWDTGSGLNVVYGVDLCRKLDADHYLLRQQTEVWDSRKELPTSTFVPLQGQRAASVNAIPRFTPNCLWARRSAPMNKIKEQILPSEQLDEPICLIVQKDAL